MNAKQVTGLVVSAGAALVFLATTAVAEGDADAGRIFALDHCARCHNVEPDGPFKLYPPSFASIAVYRSEGQIRGRMLFPPLHSSMPELGYMLVPENVDDVLAYILSLERQ